MPSGSSPPDAAPSSSGCKSSDLEGSFLAVTEVARAVDADRADNDTLARALHARFAAQGAISRAVQDCVAILGGMSFISSPDVAYLASAASAIQFHPPSIAGAASGMDQWQSGHQLRID